MAISTTTPSDKVAAGLRVWARNHDWHVLGAVELLIQQGWPDKASFRTVIHTVRGMHVIRWREARAAFDSGAFVADAGETGMAALDLAIAIGENRYKLPGQGPHAATCILDAVATAMTPALR